jgi:predicted permease
LILLGQIGRDLRHALRSIRRAPFLSAVVVASIGLGIGVNTTVFSWLQAVVFEPIAGVTDASALRLVEPRTETGGYPGTSWLEYRDLTARLPAFDTLAAFRMAPLDVGIADWSDRSYGVLVSGNYFSALGLQPSLGRFIRPADAARPGAEPVVVISDRFWRTRLAAAPSVVGQTLRVNDRPLTIVGIAPRGFQGTVVGLAFDLWLPATAAPIVFDRTTELDARGDREYTAFGVLRAGATDVAARTDLAAAMRQLAHDYPATNQTVTAELLPFWQAPRGPQRFMAGALGVLQAVMILVLLAVCGNTANLVLARATSRRQEIGVRLALGAGRWRIVSLLLTESLTLAAAGTGLGLGLAVWGTEALRAVPMPTAFPIRFETHLDLMSALFAAALGVASALTFGLAPALQLARIDPRASIASGQAAGRASGRLMQIFTAVEIGLALVVLALAGVFLQRFAQARTTDPGFTRDGVLLTAYDLRERNRNADAAASARFPRLLLDRLRAVPSIESAAVASSVPLDIHGLPTRAFELEGHSRPDGAQDQALTNTVTPGYFRTMGLALRQGTDFADLGDSTAPAQAIVNETFVRRFAPAMTILGRRLESAGRSYTIVGVVQDSIYEAFDEPPTPFIYLSYRDRAVPAGEVHLRARSGQATLVAGDLRRVVAGLDASMTLYNTRTLTENVDQNLVFQRIPARLFGLVGPLLLALAAIGISAVVAYGIAERQREIGVRLALGATSAVVTRGLVLDTMQVVAFGAAAGWAVAYVLDRDVLRSGHFDVLRFVVVPALLLGTAALAAWLPARRATRAIPLTALRGSER